MSNSSRPWYREIFVAVLIAVLAGGTSPWWWKYVAEYCDYGDTNSRWLSSNDYHQLFLKQKESKRYPAVVEGRLYEGEEQYRAKWVGYPAGIFCFHSFSGMKEAKFNERNERFQAEGYALDHKQSFLNAIGEKRFQATWTKRTGRC